jgi:hypothetical protein
MAGGVGEPQVDGAPREGRAALGEGRAPAFDGEQADDALVAEDGVGARCQGGPGVAAAAGDDGRDDLLGDPAGDLVEDGDGEFVDRGEALVEVALGQARLLADVANARRRDAAGAEQLQSGVQQLLAAGGEPLVGADSAVGARACFGRAGGWVCRGDAEILI